MLCIETILNIHTYFVPCRCNQQTFEKLCRLVENNWIQAGNSVPHWNTVFSVTQRVAVTLHFYASGAAIHEAGNLFGMSKSGTIRYVEQVRRVLVICLAPNIIKLPRSEAEWFAIVNGFEEIAGFPLVVGAVDGTLIRIERPADFEGWYCRKNFPAINMQAIVDHKGCFMSYSLRPGSSNDQSLWSRSSFGQSVNSRIPLGCHILGEGGYSINPSLITPYSDDTDDPDERLFNNIHSRTRIVVETAFGRLKNRFRIFRRSLAEKTPQHMAYDIVACICLHNFFISVGDEAFPGMHEGDEFVGEQFKRVDEIMDVEVASAEDGGRKRTGLKELFARVQM